MRVRLPDFITNATTSGPEKMIYHSLDAFLASSKTILTNGPIALVFVEDDVEVATTLRHHLQCGFKTVVALMPDVFTLPKELENQVHRIPFECHPSRLVFETLNRIIAAAADGCWLYYCFNAEYLFYPFSKTRTIGEMLAFHTEERRDSMLTYVVDLYAHQPDKPERVVSIEHAYLDRSGYYAQARKDPETSQIRERQLDFFGGLRWRFEEHIPATSRKIDRIALFRARPGLRLNANHTFNEPEYNTYSCPWHHNLTAAICSFRTAKALKHNPGSRSEIKTFYYRNSVPFQWNSNQLLDLGLMEPGQWF